MNKRNKKRGFTLIELIIVIAIIAILAAIAVPAFGQIRQKANVSADLGNARTIYSVVTSLVADESIILPDAVGTTTVAREKYTYYPLNLVGKGTKNNGAIDLLDGHVAGISDAKTYQKHNFYVGLNNNGDIKIVVASAQPTDDTADATGGTVQDGTVYEVYPNPTDRYAQ